MLKQYLVRLVSITCLVLCSLLVMYPVAPVLAIPHTYSDSGAVVKSGLITMTTGIDQNLGEAMNPVKDKIDLGQSGSQEEEDLSLYRVTINGPCTGSYKAVLDISPGYWKKLGNNKVKCINISRPKQSPHPSTKLFSECRIVPSPGGTTYEGHLTNSRSCKED